MPVLIICLLFAFSFPFHFSPDFLFEANGFYAVCNKPHCQICLPALFVLTVFDNLYEVCDNCESNDVIWFARTSHYSACMAGYVD